MEDTQNSAPGAPSAHEVAKLSPVPRRQDAQSVTKRYDILLTVQRVGYHITKTNFHACMQTPIRTHDPHAFRPTRNFRLSLQHIPPRLDRHSTWPSGYTLRRLNLQAQIRVFIQLPLFASDRPIQDTHLPSQRRLQRPYLLGYLAGEVECGVERSERSLESPELVG